MTQMMNQQCVLFLFYIGRKLNELGRTNLFKYILNNEYKLLNYCKPETCNSIYVPVVNRVF